ncbi:MAG: short-chain dehydrogenase [Betaproteobacteria bacterium RIFCSPLOWO2_12_FULL_62_13]|nr:MAG: short-chain dehydrogenase [Betaproteobacteria bacterium RIFCSPLOWO2_12_FULL_62_13]
MTTATELAGKVALVTGASRNIGRAIALALATGGAAVAVNARTSREDAEKVAHEVRAAGGQAEVFMADIAQASAVNAMVEGVIRRFGRIDILVLNASVRSEKPFTEMSYDEWRIPLAITLDGAFHCTKACLPAMIEAGGGSIVTLGGQMALSGAKRRVHGSVAKHGLVGMTRALAREFGDRGIRVNCVAPGTMNTPRAAGRSARPDAASMVPLGRPGDPEEIASTVRFLCGPGASFINGQTIHVNGGQMMF